MQKISKLTLKNFKFFYGEVTLDFERKNALIYGENGSGKSSIYWALYTFLQSVLKSNDLEIKKYFDVRHEQNLVNRFATDKAESAIIVEFEDEHEATTTRQISLKTINTKTGELVKNTLQASDFINYRLLSKIYDFSNRDSIDLFPFFERELLHFINFPFEFKSGNPNSNDWWQYLKVGMQPRTTMREGAYIAFQQSVVDFNREFETYLNKIIESANDYLQLKFKQKSKLKLEFIAASYDIFLQGSTTKRNHITLPPQIILRVEHRHDLLAEAKQFIQRPHTFLNEARLTAIGLSLRFAILDEKYIDTVPKILVLDDLLISLDMSNRDIVLEIILNEFKKYQIVVLTHDRAFFNLIKRRIELESCADDWVVKEIYQDETETGIPKPFIPVSVSYLDQAKKYLKEFDYPACANYLRKETERILKSLLPLNKTIYIKEEEGTKPLPLDQMIENFKTHYESFGSDFSDFKKLKEHKDLLLNPLSHDNVDAPIYKQELVSIVSLLDKMGKIEYKCLVPIKGDGDTFIYLIETGDDGEKWSYKIQLKEHLKALKKLDGVWELSNPECHFLARKKSSDGSVEDLKKDLKLNHGYSQIRHALQIQDKPANNLFEIIINPEKKTLKELII